MRINVSGLGVLSGAGIGPKETLEGFTAGRRNGAEVSLFDSEIKSPVYEVSGFEDHYFGKRLRTLNLCLAAVEAAVSDAELTGKLAGKRVGVAMGTTVGSILNDLDFYREYRKNGKASMAAVDRYLEGNLASAIHAILQTAGPGITVVNACASGSDAIGVGMSWMRAGICDIVIAGGADEMNRVPLCGFNSLGILSEKLCAPFDRDRTGLNLGEGAGALVLESDAHLRERGKSARAYLRGFGSFNDAHHLTSPDPCGAGLEAAVRGALSDADMRPAEVAFVNAHGTATQDNDAVEAAVLKKVFGEDLFFLSTKGYTGHTLGAAGAIEICFTLLALEEGWIPASAGFTTQDDEMGFSPVKEKTVIKGNAALSTSLGFGGCDAALVIEIAGSRS